MASWLLCWLAKLLSLYMAKASVLPWARTSGWCELGTNFRRDSLWLPFCGDVWLQHLTVLSTTLSFVDGMRVRGTHDVNPSITETTREIGLVTSSKNEHIR